MEYDMYVSNEILQETEDRLKKIRDNLLHSSVQMSSAVQRSSSFLAGRQFERTKKNTEQCVRKTEILAANLQSAGMHIAELERLLEEYKRCGYSGELT